MNYANQPRIKRPANLAVRFPGQGGFGGGGGLLPVQPSFGGGMQGGPTPIFNPHAPMRAHSPDLDNLYPESEKKALAKVIKATAVDNMGQRQMHPKEMEALEAIRALNPKFQPAQAGAARPPAANYADGFAAHPATPSSPLPMTAEEIEAYSRRARKAAKHPKLVRAEVCLNCEFFFAYTRGSDTQRLTLCKWDSTSPWDKSFTCGTSKCKDYMEIGSEPPKAEAVAEKKKRRRRSRAEIEASKTVIDSMKATDESILKGAEMLLDVKAMNDANNERANEAGGEPEATFGKPPLVLDPPILAPATNSNS